MKRLVALRNRLGIADHHACKLDDTWTIATLERFKTLRDERFSGLRDGRLLDVPGQTRHYVRRIRSLMNKGSAGS